jgi:hypothetical protein
MSATVVDSTQTTTEMISRVSPERGWMNLFASSTRRATRGVVTYNALTEPPAGFSRAESFARLPRPCAGEPTYHTLTERPADYVPGSFFAHAARQTVESVPTYKALTRPLDDLDVALAANDR